MKNNSKRCEGFGLIEVIISIAVIAVLLIGVSQMVTSSMKNNKEGQVEQESSRYAQKIFEDFKSSEVTKTISATNLKLSNGLKLEGNAATGYATVGYVDLDNNRYKAYIEVKANSTGMGTALNKQISQETIDKGNKLEVNLIKNGKDVEINGNSVTDNYNKANPLTLYVETKINTETNKKEIIIKTADNKELLIEEFVCNTEEEKNKAISLVINLENYKLVDASNEDIIIKVLNEDNKDINIIAKEKSENLLISLEQYGSGEFSFYDEKSNIDLYDVTVKVKRDGKIIFEGLSQQNMKVIKAGG